MGDLQRSLFGGSKQSSNSTSQNQAYPYLSQAFQPFVNNGAQAGNSIADMLGLNGAPGQQQGFDNWRNSTGYQFGLDQGREAITGGMATKGLLNSGATGKALTKFGNDYASTKYGDYMSQLQGLLNPALQAGNVISGAGQMSQSQSKGSTANGGFGGVVGTLLGK